MAKYVAESLYICSIYPGKLEPIRLYHGPNPDPSKGRATLYHLPPVPRGGKPFVKEISDAFENVPNPIKANGGRMVFDSSPISCQEIMAQLLRQWAGNMVGIPSGAAPGIMEIANTVPIKHELERMMATQNAFYEFLFQEGERFHQQNNWKSITQTMRDAADWVGQKRAWSHPENSAEMSTCPGCALPIKAAAVVCNHCGTRLKALPDDIAALNPSVPIVGARAPQPAA